MLLTKEYSVYNYTLIKNYSHNKKILKIMKMFLKKGLFKKTT